MVKLGEENGIVFGSKDFNKLNSFGEDELFKLCVKKNLNEEFVNLNKVDLSVKYQVLH